MNMMRLVKGVCVFILFLIITAPSSGALSDHRDYLFEQGNQFFQNGEYEKALNSYGEILQMGYESADLYYNMGNCHYKLGENARAILNYERALRIRPRDEDIRFNLQIANLSVTDKIQEIPELFYVRYYKQFRSLFSLRALTLISLIFYFFVIGSLVAWLLIRNRSVRRVLKAALIVFLIFFIVSSLTTVSKILSMKRRIEAVVMVQEVNVRSAPQDEATEIFTIHEGLKIRISNKRGDWYEIRLADGNEGWLPAKDVEII
jgi:tetratricopeptide (TPR) repeat protein